MCYRSSASGPENEAQSQKSLERQDFGGMISLRSRPFFLVQSTLRSENVSLINRIQ